MSWTITRGHLARFFGTKEAIFVTLIQPSFFRHPFSTPKMCFMHILPFVALVSHFYLNCITTIHTNAHFFRCRPTHWQTASLQSFRPLNYMYWIGINSGPLTAAIFRDEHMLSCGDIIAATLALHIYITTTCGNLFFFIIILYSVGNFCA